MTAGTEGNSQAKQEVIPPQQPIIYGYMPDQPGDEIDLGELFGKLAKQWKLIAGITLGGTLLSIILALSIPKTYQPSITVSTPSTGNVVPLATINELLKRDKENSSESNSEEVLPSSPQTVFNHYFNLLRSKVVLTEYIKSKDYLSRFYPDSKQPEDKLLGNLEEGFEIIIEEPSPEKKGAYIENPVRVRASLEILDEALGVELMNGYPGFINQKLIGNFHADTQEIIDNRLDELNRQITQLREQSKQARLLRIQRIEESNAQKIAQLEEVIAALLVKAKAARETTVAEAEEALQISKSLNITYPTTLEALALRGQKGQVASTSVTVGDEQTSSLYLQGTKYLGTLIETLKNREGDERFLSEINDLRERIRLIQTDPVLAALKARKSDDPWIKGLPEKLAELDALKTLTPDFTNLIAFSLDDSAVVADEAIKPNRKQLVVIGFVLSFLFGTVFSIMLAKIKNE